MLVQDDMTSALLYGVEIRFSAHLRILEDKRWAQNERAWGFGTIRIFVGQIGTPSVAKVLHHLRSPGIFRPVAAASRPARNISSCGQHSITVRSFQEVDGARCFGENIAIREYFRDSHYYFPLQYFLTDDLGDCEYYGRQTFRDIYTSTILVQFKDTRLYFLHETLEAGKSQLLAALSCLFISEAPLTEVVEDAISSPLTLENEQKRLVRNYRIYSILKHQNNLNTFSLAASKADKFQRQLPSRAAQYPEPDRRKEALLIWRSNQVGDEEVVGGPRADTSHRTHKYR
ncbi:hypothetical protein K440DRAFT_636061 [Wilcoxina mikolae CBS 423.85]|nr:hypothetical protein K440DRAFT_636061 [Wilcoxina mikolae CBS 423.85]